MRKVVRERPYGRKGCHNRFNFKYSRFRAEQFYDEQKEKNKNLTNSELWELIKKNDSK